MMSMDIQFPNGISGWKTMERGENEKYLHFNGCQFRRGVCVCVCVCLVIQSCLTLCDPMDCSLPGSSVHGDFLGKVTGVDCHALFHGIFPTQGSTPGLPYCRWILYRLSHQGSPIQEGSCLQSPNIL